MSIVVHAISAAAFGILFGLLLPSTGTSDIITIMEIVIFLMCVLNLVTIMAELMEVDK